MGQLFEPPANLMSIQWMNDVLNVHLRCPATLLIYISYYLSLKCLAGKSSILLWLTAVIGQRRSRNKILRFWIYCDALWHHYVYSYSCVVLFVNKNRASQMNRVVEGNVLTSRTTAAWAEVAQRWPSGVGRTAFGSRGGRRARLRWASQSCSYRSPWWIRRTSSSSLPSRSCRRCLAYRYRVPACENEKIVTIYAIAAVRF